MCIAHLYHLVCAYVQVSHFHILHYLDGFLIILRSEVGIGIPSAPQTPRSLHFSWISFFLLYSEWLVWRVMRQGTLVQPVSESLGSQNQPPSVSPSKRYKTLTSPVLNVQHLTGKFKVKSDSSPAAMLFLAALSHQHHIGSLWQRGDCRLRQLSGQRKVG